MKVCFFIGHNIYRGKYEVRTLLQDKLEGLGGKLGYTLNKVYHELMMIGVT